MDAEGNVLAKQGERTVEGFAKTHKSLGEFLKLEKKAKAGDRKAGIEALVTGLELGRYGAEEGKEMAAKLAPIPADKQKVIDGILINLEVDGMMTGVRTQEQAAEVGRKFLAMEKDGRVPTGRSATTFYAVIMAAQAADKDIKGYEKSLATMRKLLDGERNAERMLKRYEDTLAELKKGEG